MSICSVALRCGTSHCVTLSILLTCRWKLAFIRDSTNDMELSPLITSVSHSFLWRTRKKSCVVPASTVPYLISVCLARSSADSMGDCMRSTVRNAARLAVYDEMMIRVKNHQIPPTIRPDTDLQTITRDDTAEWKPDFWTGPPELSGPFAFWPGPARFADFIPPAGFSVIAFSEMKSSRLDYCETN